MGGETSSSSSCPTGASFVLLNLPPTHLEWPTPFPISPCPQVMTSIYKLRQKTVLPEVPLKGVSPCGFQSFILHPSSKANLLFFHMTATKKLNDSIFVPLATPSCLFPGLNCPGSFAAPLSHGFESPRHLAPSCGHRSLGLSHEVSFQLRAEQTE